MNNATTEDVGVKKTRPVVVRLLKAAVLAFLLFLCYDVIAAINAVNNRIVPVGADMLGPIRIQQRMYSGRGWNKWHSRLFAVFPGPAISPRADEDREADVQFIAQRWRISYATSQELARLSDRNARFCLMQVHGVLTNVDIVTPGGLSDNEVSDILKDSHYYVSLHYPRLAWFACLSLGLFYLLYWIEQRRRHRLAKASKCYACGYDLGPSPSAANSGTIRCPECGTEVHAPTTVGWAMILAPWQK